MAGPTDCSSKMSTKYGSCQGNLALHHSGSHARALAGIRMACERMHGAGSRVEGVMRTLRQMPRATASPGSQVTPMTSMRYGTASLSAGGPSSSTSQYLQERNCPSRGRVKQK